MDLANSFYKSRQWDSADYYFGEVIELGKKTEEWDKVMFAYFRRGERWWKNGRVQRTIDTLEKGLAIGYEQLGENYWFYSKYYLVLAKCERVRNNYTQALSYCHKAEFLMKKYHVIPEKSSIKIGANQKTETGLGGCYSVYAQIYQTKGMSDSAIHYFALAIQEMNKFPKKQKISLLGVKNQLAWLYVDYGDLQKASELSRKGLAIVNKSNDMPEVHRKNFRSQFYTLLGYISYDLKDFEEALIYLEMSDTNYFTLIRKGLIFGYLKEYDKSMENYNAAINLMEQSPVRYFVPLNEAYRAQAEIYIRMGDVKAAKKNLAKSEKLILERSTEDQRKGSARYKHLIGELYLAQGKMYLLSGEKELAETYLNKAIQSGSGKFQSQKTYVNIFAFKLLGDLKLENNQYKEALSFYDESIKKVSPQHFAATNNPEISLPINYDYLFDALVGKAKTYYQWYSNGQRRVHLEKSIELYEEALSIIDKAKDKYDQETTKIRFTSNGAQIMDKLTQCFIDMFEETQDDNYLKKAFTIADKNKAGVLKEIIQRIKTRQSLGIPDSILEKESALKIKLAYFEKKIFNRSYSLTPEEILQDSIISEYIETSNDIKVQLETLTQEINQSYPEYNPMSEQLAYITTEEVQTNMLAPGEALVEYVIGKSKIYAFLIKKDDFKIIPIDRNDSLTYQIDMLRQGIYGYWTSLDRTIQNKKEHDKLYTTYAQVLYKSLVEPIFPYGEIPKRITIIPDGILNYVPFEVLLSEAPQTIGLFNQYAYLINQTQISYGFSAALLLEMTQKSIKAKNNLLALAPTFKESDNLEALSSSRRDNFSPLLYTEDEVNYLGDMFGGEIWTSDKAAKQSFIEQAQNYRIIHLATHAKMLDDQPKFSRIAFTQLNDTIDQPDFLTIAEIYNLKLNAEMVVLSACETGTGKLQKGEGVMSMSRAFAFSGTKSIITSLWSVDDQATSKIMKSFYSYLDQGETKDAALQKAKLDYINNHDSQASHPFFWAGFVGFGDMSPTSLQPSYTWAWILTIIGLLLGILAYIAYRRKS